MFPLISFRLPFELPLVSIELTFAPFGLPFELPLVSFGLPSTPFSRFQFLSFELRMPHRCDF
jgi:hypothetical protein